MGAFSFFSGGGGGVAAEPRASQFNSRDQLNSVQSATDRPEGLEGAALAVL